MTQEELEQIAINMAIRHPDALKYTKEFVLNGIMKEINEQINNYLFENFGLDFSYTDIKDINGETVEYNDFSDINCSISKPTPYISLGKIKIYTLACKKKEIKIPPKTLKSSKDKNELNITSINHILFKLYDAKYISNMSVYSVDKTLNSTTRNNDKLNKLHNIINEKLWNKLL